MSEEREEELATTQAIYPEIVLSPSNPYSASLDIAVHPAEPVLLKFVGSEHTSRLKHLPPLKLHIQLPNDYPDSSPPEISLSSQHGWLPVDNLLELQDAVVSLWEEYGRSQVVYVYIDHLQQYVDQIGSSDKAITLPASLQAPLEQFDAVTTIAVFNAGTYDCGICLEPKKGHACHQLVKCGHIFCKQCFLDFYNNAITEGDVVTVRCLDPECGKGGKGRKRSLHPRELLAIGLEETMVRRYVEMKRKKKMESDKTTVFCPRDWCQKPARSAKYPPIPDNLLDYPELSDIEETDDKSDEPVVHPAVPANSNGDDERLAICEGCKLAFCKTCYSTWHGSYQRCRPRNPGELTEEEQASFNYIAANSSPCPSCSAAIIKSMGCNHMQCYQCQTHFCYLCSAWLIPTNPYAHFNTVGTPCYQRLWELEEGDNGQAPGDGQGFAGPRAAEAAAIQLAAELDAVDLQEANAQVGPPAGFPPAPAPPAAVPVVAAPAVQPAAAPLAHGGHPAPPPAVLPAALRRAVDRVLAAAAADGRELPLAPPFPDVPDVWPQPREPDILFELFPDDILHAQAIARGFRWNQDHIDWWRHAERENMIGDILDGNERLWPVRVVQAMQPQVDAARQAMFDERRWRGGAVQRGRRGRGGPARRGRGPQAADAAPREPRRARHPRVPRRPAAPPVNDEGHQQEEMRRFVELALRDQEDDWDSDEFADDDDDFHIH